MLFGYSTSVILMKSPTPGCLQAVMNRAYMWCHILCLSGTCTIDGQCVKPGMYLTLSSSMEMQTVFVVSGEEPLTLMVDFFDDALLSEDPPTVSKNNVLKKFRKQKADLDPELAVIRRKEHVKKKPSTHGLLTTRLARRPRRMR